jgi:hypothetical protein
MVFTRKFLVQVPLWIFLYQEGRGHTAIAKMCGASASTIYKYLKYFDIIRSENSSVLMMGDKNPMWAGDKVQYLALHNWVKRRKPKPEKCEICHERPALDLANNSNTFNANTYTRELSNWRWLCRRCHMKIDGRMENLKQYAK